MIHALAIALFIPLLLMIFLLQDDLSKKLLQFFAWGIIAGVLAYHINRGSMDVFNISREELGIEFAPLIEEFIKALPLFYLYIVSSPQLKEKDIVLRGIFAGIGFSVIENYYYLVNESGLEGAALVAFIATRSFSTTIMHGLSTGLIGFSLFFLVKGKLNRFGFIYIYVIMAFSFSVMFHALFNLYVVFSLFGKLIAVIAVVLLYLGAWICFELYYEKL